MSVLIIGAGINGIGVCRELALHGIDVLLVDRGDFCAGASSASSHMAHGGLRYLENGEFRLVREALTERNRLLRNAPHLVRPLPTVIPIFHWFSGFLNAPLKFLGIREKPGERGAVVIKIGLTLYDFFTRKQRETPRHGFMSRQKSMEVYPLLASNILCTASYYDGYIRNPEQLCIELILDSEALGENVQALNYVSFVGGAQDRVQLRDELTGEVFEVKPKLVINAAGPWIDLVNGRLSESTHFIGGTKGSHLMIDQPELYRVLDGREFYYENKDGRLCLILPYEGKLMVGSTDIRVDDPDQAVLTEQEIDYMLNAVSVIFPQVKLSRSDIVYTFTGVRPLPPSEASTTGQISRDHSIRVIEPNDSITFPVYSLVGGKWTTFRAFAEQVADRVLKHLQMPRRQSTYDLPIGGGRNYPRDAEAQQLWVNRVQAQTRLPRERVEVLFRRYGTLAEDVAVFLAAGQDEMLVGAPTYSQREVAFLATKEKVVHLDDMILRRTLFGICGLVNAALMNELAPIVGAALGWSDAQTADEVERAVRILTQEHHVSQEKLIGFAPASTAK
ncbi:MAG: glycerol-3-phosphate dehydrogenase/oxidase [Anaerolineae bacterium]